MEIIEEFMVPVTNDELLEKEQTRFCSLVDTFCRLLSQNCIDIIDDATREYTHIILSDVMDGSPFTAAQHPRDKAQEAVHDWCNETFRVIGEIMLGDNPNARVSTTVRIKDYDGFPHFMISVKASRGAIDFSDELTVYAVKRK